MKNDKELESLWRSRIENWKVSGKNGHKWARENNFHYTTFIYWRDKFGKPQKKTSPVFVELKDRPLKKSGVEVEISGCIIRVQQGFDPSLLLLCAQLLRKLPC